MAMKKTKTDAEIGDAPLVYVTRDIERALGQKPVGSYFILANSTPYAETIRAQYPDNVFLVKDPSGFLDTFDVLKAGEKILEKIAGSIDVLVFKNTSRIEEFCAEKKWKLLNPPTALAEKIENKITQVEWLGDGTNGAARFLPPYFIKKTSEITLRTDAQSGVSAPFMLQWAHTHTGEGTMFIANNKSGEKMLADLREKFPKREARVTAYVNGPVFTANVCVMPDGDILVGNISNQITGMLPFTDNPWTTVGNDWSLPQSILNEEKIAQFHDIARTVGERMRKSGWLGLFGIDCIYDIERDNLHLIEVNARQPASTTYESQLQEQIRELAADHFTTHQTIFEAHIAALRNKNTETKTKPVRVQARAQIVEINDGAQIILRISALKELRKTDDEIAKISAGLRAQKYTVIEYTNVKPGMDMLRIQSERGIMESHNKFNARGKKILEIVTGGQSTNEEPSI